jgi:hypothetical protein
LRRVAASAQFQRATRLRDFLTYVAEKSLADPAAEIHESEIAEHVFGREPGSTDDTIVRVHATQLRRRLELYFNGPGAGEPIIIEIPKRNYAACFKPRSVEPAPEPGPSAPVGSGARPPQLPRVLAGAVVVLACLVIALVFWSVRLRRQLLAAHTPTPEVAAFWSSLIEPQRSTDIVVADSGLSLFSSAVRRGTDVAQYANGAHWNYAGQFAKDPPLHELLKSLSDRRYTSYADAILVGAIADAYGLHRGRTRILFARDFQARSVATDHLVLLGSARSNPWVSLFERDLNFRSVYDESQGPYFENRRPRPGEPAVFRPVSSEGKMPESYCRIVFTSHNEGPGHVLSIAGTEMEGTEAGGTFLTREDSLRELRRMLRVPDGAEYPFFEVLLRTSRLGGTAPEAHIAAYRLLK